MSAQIKTETFEKLRERIPQGLLHQRQQGGTTLSYISWYDACELLDQRAPGWSMEIKQVGEMCGKVFVRVALTIEGVTRENIGSEDEDLKGYGDVFSNSVGMALRRAAALFGLGRHLYDKTDRGGNAGGGNNYQRSQPARSNVSPMPNLEAKASTVQVARIRDLRKSLGITTPLDFNSLTTRTADELIANLQRG